MAFFSSTESSQALGKKYVARIKLRKTDRDLPVSIEAAKAQAIARELWGNSQAGYNDLLKTVKVAVLVTNGKDDIRMPTINSYNLFKILPRAQLILYPDAGHGFLFQYPKLCAENFNEFLDQDEI